MNFDASDNRTQEMISVGNRQKVSGLPALSGQQAQPAFLLAVVLAYAKDVKIAALQAVENYLELCRVLGPAKSAIK